MAKPIQATPVLTGKSAKAFIEATKSASYKPENAARMEQARATFRDWEQSLSVPRKK
jgi:hypothetical protein